MGPGAFEYAATSTPAASSPQPPRAGRASGPLSAARLPLLPHVESSDDKREHDQHPEHRARIEDEQCDEGSYHEDDRRDLPSPALPSPHGGRVSDPFLGRVARKT